MPEQLESRTLLNGLPLDWSAGASLPIARGRAAALSTYNGILLLGGSPASGSSSAVLRLDPGTDQWVTAPSLDRQRVSPGVGQTGTAGPIVNGQYKYSGDIFVFGGSNTATTANYDPSPGGEGITNAPSMSVARSGFAYATDPSTGDLFAIGGSDGSGHALASAERYDPGTDSWSAIAPLPAARSATTGAYDGDGHIVVFGGDNSAGAPVADVYRYSIATNTWDVRASMPAALSDSTAVFAFYGTIYVVGGKTTGGAAVADVESYNPVLDSWTSEAPLPAAVYDATGVVDVTTGELTIVGGFNAQNTAVSSVLVTPIGDDGTVLPQPPKLSFDNTYFVYDGTSHAVTATALSTDGVTPVDGTFTFTYNGSPTPPTLAGDYTIVGVFTSNDSNYVDDAIRGDLQIAQATPTITLTGGGTIRWDGNPHPVTATQVGVDGMTPVAGSFAITYNGSTSAPVNPGSYAVVATFTSTDSNYANATATTTITIPDPTIPTNATAAGASTTSIRVSWDPIITPAAYYNVYERHVAHSPRGSGVTITWPLVAGGVTGTSVILPVAAAGPGTAGHIYRVTSVSPANVESPPSVQTNAASPYYAPSLYSATSGQILVGQTATITLNYYGNPKPTFSIVSGPPTMSIDPGSGTVTYTPTAAEVGYVPVTFQATNVVGTSTLSTSFHVQALPTVQVSGGPFAADGSAHSATATAVGLDGATPVSGTFSFTYNGSATAPSDPGVYTVVASFFSSDPDYANTTATGSIAIGLLVTNTNDSGPGSLRQALLDTDASDPVVAVAPGVSGNIELTSGGLSNGGYVVIVGPGSGVLSVDSPTSPTFEALAGSSIYISGITVTNASISLQADTNAQLTLTDVGANGELLAEQGRILFDSPSGDTSQATLDVQGGYAGFASSIQLAALNVASAGAAAITTSASAGAVVLNVANLVLNDSSTLDLRDQELLTGDSPAAVRSYLFAGQLISTQYTNGQTTALGYIDQGGGITRVQLTLLGDSNLDGNVDVSDLANLAGHFGVTAGATWLDGDFNYDGKVDVADVADLAGQFGKHYVPGSASASPAQAKPAAAAGAAPVTAAASPASASAEDDTRRRARSSVAKGVFARLPTTTFVA
jgi:hypothetical protein